MSSLGGVCFRIGRSGVGVKLLLGIGLGFGLLGGAGAQTSISTGPAKPSVKMAPEALPVEAEAELNRLAAELRKAQAAGDRVGQAVALKDSGNVYLKFHRYEEALGFYDRGLTVARAAGDRSDESKILADIALVRLDRNQFAEALAAYNQGILVSRAMGDKKHEAELLRNSGLVSVRQMRYGEAAEFYRWGLELARDIGDKALEAAILNSAGDAAFRQRRYGEARASFDQALVLARGLGDRALEVTSLIDAGNVSVNENNPEEALRAGSEALEVARQLTGAAGREQALLRIADLLRYVNERGLQEQALLRSVSSEALALAREQKDQSAEARALYDLAKAEELAGKPKQALDDYTETLGIYTRLGDQDGVKKALFRRADMYAALNDVPKGLEDVDEALRGAREAGDRTGELEALSSRGPFLRALGRFEEALEDQNKVLVAERERHNESGEAFALQHRGTIYGSLGDEAKALADLGKALVLFRKLDSRAEQAGTLESIAYHANVQGDSERALEALNEALKIRVWQHNRTEQGYLLDDLCAVYGIPAGKAKALDTGKALGYCTEALGIFEPGGFSDGETFTLIDFGRVYAGLGNHAKAIEFYDRALPLATAGHREDVLPDLLFYLMKEYSKDKPELAIFFGKQSVNLLQQARRNTEGLDKALQASFVKSNEDHYRGLAEVLIAQGRLLEAQQVLDLLKQKEYREYTRGEVAKANQMLDLTPAEQAAAADYERSTQTLVSESEEFGRLRRLESRTAEQEAEYQRLSVELSTGKKGLNEFYKRLFVYFGSDSRFNRQIADVKGTTAQLQQQIARTPHAVALYTMINQDRYSVIVITGSTMVAREVIVAETDLNTWILNFRRALQDPAQDPRGLGEKLYKILIGPVQADLDQAAAETLVWSVDGAMRYIPMSALYDGKHYLVERYNSVNYSPASASLSDVPNLAMANAVAMGVSRQYDMKLSALPEVVTELHGIVREPQTPEGGVMPGAILLDTAFTEVGMMAKLDGQRNIVHIASHFVLHQGDDTNSFLLLAGKEAGSTDGYHLTVADFRDDERISLTGTDLLTLSACDTGISSTGSDGREVDGLGTTALNKGAKAVLSSLWQVSDVSTGQFMTDFYRRWVDGKGKLMKVEAVRQAKLDLLHGTMYAGMGKTTAAGEAAPFTHPYYWAPFVLVGNWR